MNPINNLRSELKLELADFRRESKSDYPSNQKLKTRLKKNLSEELEEKFEVLHNELFQNLAFLDCVNCCKTTSPIFFLQPDIDRLAKAFKMKSSGFIET